MATKRRLKVEQDSIGEKLLTLRDVAGDLRMNRRTLEDCLRRREIEEKVIDREYSRAKY